MIKHIIYIIWGEGVRVTNRYVRVQQTKRKLLIFTHLYPRNLQCFPSLAPILAWLIVFPAWYYCRYNISILSCLCTHASVTGYSSFVPHACYHRLSFFNVFHYCFCSQLFFRLRVSCSPSSCHTLYAACILLFVQRNKRFKRLSL